MKKKVALIFGITGQDGSYLAEILLKKKYIVHGVNGVNVRLMYVEKRVFKLEPEAVLCLNMVVKTVRGNQLNLNHVCRMLIYARRPLLTVVGLISAVGVLVKY